MGHHSRSAPLSPEEKAKRAVALTVAETAQAKALSFTCTVTAARISDLVPIEMKPGEEVVERPREMAPLDQPRQRRIPDHPVVTVTISGLPGSGKSVIAHLIRNALAYEGISAEGPQQLRSVLWRRGAQDLIQRGLTVVLRAETSDA